MRQPLRRFGLAIGLATAVVAFAVDTPRDPQVGKSFRVPYKVTATNHFLVRVRINGKGPFNFLVDTGAPALYVGTEAAKAAGLVEAKDSFWTTIDRFDFEGGASLKGMKGRIEDPFQLIGMNALGLPGASIDGILGFTILARYKIELDPTKDRMVWTRLDFEPKEPWVPRGATTKQAPAEVQAMNLLGPLAKGMAALIGKQPEDVLIPRGGLGVAVEESGRSVKVTAVLDGSPAAKAGLKVGDVIERVEDKRVRTIKAAFDAMGTVKPGDKVTLNVRRDGQALDLKITAGEGF